jgi:hypothetical protein
MYLKKNGQICTEISEKIFMETNPLCLFLNELHLLYRTQHHNTTTLRRPTSLQHHLELYRGRQLAKKNSRKKHYTKQNVTPLQVKYTKS